MAEMEASPRRTLHHHHYHRHHHCHFICHHGHRHFICYHSPALPVTPEPAQGLQIPTSITSIFGPQGVNSEALHPEEAERGESSAAQIWQGQDYDAQIEDYQDYNELSFVLTDEWKEFFAQSEAKRREVKNCARGMWSGTLLHKDMIEYLDKKIQLVGSNTLFSHM